MNAVEAVVLAAHEKNSCTTDSPTAGQTAGVALLQRAAARGYRGPIRLTGSRIARSEVIRVGSEPLATSAIRTRLRNQLIGFLPRNCALVCARLIWERSRAVFSATARLTISCQPESKPAQDSGDQLHLLAAIGSGALFAGTCGLLFRRCS